MFGNAMGKAAKVVGNVGTLALDTYASNWIKVMKEKLGQ